MSKNGIFIIILFLSSICFAQNAKPTKVSELKEKSKQEYSGVYEGVLDYSTCCANYDSASGWIALDFESDPPVVLFDGVFYKHIVLLGDKLVDSSGYSDHPNQILGQFGVVKGIQGIWYNNIGIDLDKPVKVFLKKTADLHTARELIAKYTSEKEKWDSFFGNFKLSVLNKDYKFISSLCYSFPISENSCKTSELTDEIYDEKELVKRLKIIFDNVNSEENIHFSKFEDHHPMGGNKYEVNCGAQFQFMEFEGEYRLIGIYCYG
ncbi:MAG: hypothetical protein IAE90_10285 [Ignavibacteria bacterium]|nr:hypothetical protein [Ignavibacteria bacterium]